MNKADKPLGLRGDRSRWKRRRLIRLCDGFIESLQVTRSFPRSSTGAMRKQDTRGREHIYPSRERGDRRDGHGSANRLRQNTERMGK